VQYEDRLSIPTPEGVELQLTLAGVGSRFVATLVDQVIQWSIIIALILLVDLVGGGAETFGLEPGTPLVVGAFVMLVLAVQLGYDVAFEVLASGRTPGKRWTGLRVVKLGGAPVGFLTSAVRNLLRIVDALPGFYAVGIIAVLASSRNQRLGDLAAGTLVVRERGDGRTRARRRAAPAPPPPPRWAEWDVSSVTADELATVRRFLDRRDTLTVEARRRLSEELARRLRPKVVCPDGEDERPEVFLEELAAVKSARL
jgi:uncharacterized RDD family membrane protein YckC